MSEFHNAVILNENAVWSDPVSLAVSASANGSRTKAFSGEVWETLIAVTVLLCAVKLSYDAFSMVRLVATDISPDGAAAGWWWTASMIWVAALKWNDQPVRDGMLSRRFGNRALRGYLAMAFSMVAVLEMIQQGPAGIMGVIVGGLSFLTVFMLAKVCPN
jgi:hypothetical protein